MGLFDLRCGISGLSTTFWPPFEDGPRSERSTCSMFLLEELDGRLVPWTPPLSGSYDGYGGIELWPQDRTDYSRWLDTRLPALVEEAVLVSSWQDDLEDACSAEKVLKHGAETVYNAVKLAIDGRRVAACIVLDQVADAIYADDTSPAQSVAEACTVLFPEGGSGRNYLAQPPECGLPQLARYASVARFAASAGFTPIRSDNVSQQAPDDVRRYARTAWERDGNGPIARYVARCKPDWIARWRKSRDEADRRAEALTAPPKPWSAKGEFAKGDVITHPTLGTGLVQELVGADKIRVRFGKQDKILVHKRP